MQLGPVSMPDKSNTVTSKKFDYKVSQQIVTSLSFLQFMVNLQP